MSTEQWVRLPISALSAMLEQRFGRLERDTKQLRDELSHTQEALEQMKHGLITIQGDQQLTASELRAELSKLTLAIGALTSGNVTVRTREVQYSPAGSSKPETPPPPEWAESARAALPAARTVVDGSGAVNATVPPPRPKPGAPAGGQARSQYKKPQYSVEPLPAQPPAVRAADSEGERSATKLSQEQAEPAARARTFADRVLKALGVEPPKS